MSRWSNYKDQAPKSSGDGKYIDLKDGDSVRFALTDAEPGQLVQYWVDRKPVAAGTKGAEMSTKIVLCVFDVDLEKMRILKITPPTFVRLCDKADKFKEDSAPNVYELERQSKGGKTVYEIDRLDRLTPAQVQARDRERTYDVLEEKGVEALPEAAAEPIRGTSAMPPERQAGEDAPDEAVPF